MTPRPLHLLLRLFWSTMAAGAAGFATLVAAIAVASLRFARCGASSLHATATACRLGAQLLAGAYVVLSVALVLGAASLTLLWRLRRLRGRR